MALPIIAAISVAGLVTHYLQKESYRQLSNADSRRRSDERIGTVMTPSDSYWRGREVTPTEGAIVCCELYGVLDHTGIWIDRDCIIELGNNGLVKAVSAERFLTERSGQHIYVACNSQHEPVVIENAASRAVSQLYTYREYDVINNNCHRFVHQCLTGSDVELTRFSTLSDATASLAHCALYWERAKF